ncbi:hypothetical protein [Anthocerotibacter panamensis]|uniref:hypothetical protein n=1 Tax=Anthocerotibacter panamensis TaxID=2857077 RepID=UPI001C406C6E|nr:hypothetical protein [Anthocerotibacter panamensis]
MAQPLKWMTLFCRSLSCSQDFAQRLEQQLADQLIATTHLDLAGCFLVPLDDEDTQLFYDPEGIGHVTTELVTPDNYGHPVSISWLCIGPSPQKIEPSESVPATCQLKVWWEDLPVADLKYDSLQKNNTPELVVLKTSFQSMSFFYEVAWKQFCWPDIWLELEARAAFSDKEIQQLETALIQAREDWNQRTLTQNPDRGLIHNIGVHGLRRIEPTRLEVYIDFGSAHLEALIIFFQALEGACPYPLLEAVTVHGSPISTAH